MTSFSENSRRRIVLVADDDVITQKIVKAGLERAGFEARVVGDGNACLAEIAAGVRPVLLILDLLMPGVGGIQVLKELKASGEAERMPILVFSGEKHQEFIQEAINLGADDYLLKPININDLMKRATDLVFDVEEAAVRDVLANLRMQNPALLRDPDLSRWIRTPHDAYSTLYKGKSVCILVESGEIPRDLAVRKDFDDVMNAIIILRKCSYGWRALWSNK